MTSKKRTEAGSLPAGRRPSSPRSAAASSAKTAKLSPESGSRTPRAKPEIKAVHVLIQGRVQGVGFRYCALREAQHYRITGYIRNLEDGDVEVVAEGREPELSSFIGWLYQGPSGAWISNVSVSPEPVTGYGVFAVDFY